MEWILELVGRVDVLNGFEAPFDIINKVGEGERVQIRAVSFRAV